MGKQSAKLRSQVKTFKTKMRMETQRGQGLGVCFVSCTTVTTTVHETGWAHSKYFMNVK